MCFIFLLNRNPKVSHSFSFHVLLFWAQYFSKILLVFHSRYIEGVGHFNIYEKGNNKQKRRCTDAENCFDASEWSIICAGTPCNFKSSAHDHST